MTIADSINGGFETFGSVAVMMNIAKLLKDKQVKGIHWGSTIFFTSWGLWNLWYYPHLSQWGSFLGGVMLCASNVVWLGLRLYYWRRRRRNDNVPKFWQGLED